MSVLTDSSASLRFTPILGEGRFAGQPNAWKDLVSAERGSANDWKTSDYPIIFTQLRLIVTQLATFREGWTVAIECPACACKKGIIVPGIIPHDVHEHCVECGCTIKPVTPEDLEWWVLNEGYFMDRMTPEECEATLASLSPEAREEAIYQDQERVRISWGKGEDFKECLAASQAALGNNCGGRN